MNKAKRENIQADEFAQRIKGHSCIERPSWATDVVHIKDNPNATGEGSIIFDFFGGSGTTGHAVMQFCREQARAFFQKHKAEIEKLIDACEREGRPWAMRLRGLPRFILVQNAEPIKEKHQAYKFCVDNNLPPVISSITTERVRRAGKKIAVEDYADYVDLGFKVLKVVEDKKNERTTDDVLINMINKTGIDFAVAKVNEVIKDALYLVDGHYFAIADCDFSKIEAGRRVYVYGDGGSLDDRSLLAIMERAGDSKLVSVVYW